MPNYFAYGSNLNLRQMRRRCPGATVVSRAVLHRHRLAFSRPGSYWAGGVAGILPDSAACVEGAVYELSDANARRLDEYEGVAKGEYTRRCVLVWLPDGTDLEVYTYIARPMDGGPFLPSPRYLAAVIDGAHDHQLSVDWIAHLRKFASDR